ncbi:uncharacterized protein [Lolium perenne]|uniref:uncharacterized protein n=1 Tax=Lolium perenne TaxID=4522 RepID=UPI003A9A4326
MPRIRMRQSVLKFLVQAFDLKTSTFGLNEGKDHISLGGKEIYALFGLEDKGLNAVAIIAQEGKEAQGRIPPEWLDPSTENLLIDDLILDVELRGASDDDFVRKAMMVLLATVIAPYSNKVISKPMYALVEDLDRARKINWNSFTLEYTLEGIRQCKGGRVMRQWPKGNMAALQYMYWEKVQPPGAPAFNPLVCMYPLMKNWTEVEGKKRDASDAQYGRGKGNIDNDITAEHRLSKINTANSVGRKTSVSRKATKTPAKNPPYMEQLLERVNRMAGELTLVRKQIATIADLCAERVIAKLNQEGIIYRRENKGTSEGDKESESSQKGVYPSKYFTSVQKDEDADDEDVDEDELDNANGSTPAPPVARKLMTDDPQPSVLFNCSKGDKKDPIKITNDVPARSSSSLSSSAFVSAKPNEPQKQKRMPSAKVRSPYLSEKMANKRQFRDDKNSEGNFHSLDALLQVNDLTEDHVEVAVSLVKELSKCSRRRNKKVYSSEGLVLTAHHVAPIITHDWLMGDVINAYVRHLSSRVPDDRVMSTTWRSTHLIEGRTRGRDVFPPGHHQIEIEKNRAIHRCMDEYFHKPKYYLAVNVNGNHWVTVVMHVPKKEFQVLDSLYVLRSYIHIIEALRTELAYDIAKADHGFPDPSNWPIKQYKMPRQKDG